MGGNCSIPDIIPYNRVETERETPKLKFVREGHSNTVIKHRKTSLLTLKNFNMVLRQSRPQQTKDYMGR